MRSWPPRTRTRALPQPCVHISYSNQRYFIPFSHRCASVLIAVNSQIQDVADDTILIQVRVRANARADAGLEHVQTITRNLLLLYQRISGIITSTSHLCTLCQNSRPINPSHVNPH